MAYVYGPVPSWRLGRSLGVDPVPLKTCNWNCVYCQLGRTRPVVNVRREYVPADALVAELRQALATRTPQEIDWVTFVGSGEPLLHARLGDMLRAAKAMTDRPVALLTNGSLLYRSEVRDEVAVADAVLPTLDVGCSTLYRRLNRPHPDVTFARHLEGLVAFRQMFRGRLWVEVMLVRGVNDTEPVLRGLTSALGRVRPDEIHLNVPSRPPVEPWVRAPDPAAVRRAAEMLEGVAPVRTPPAVGAPLELGACADVVETIAAIVTRHPITERALRQALARRAPGAVRAALDALERSGRVRLVVRDGTAYWTAATAYFPDALADGQSSDTP
jgi:wyosine [tRNA(Phe)-imidazoG37] synthetase (radical SAM superfamily)